MQSSNPNATPQPPEPSPKDSSAVATADPGLPPVVPLTAGYIGQLFLVPGLIVAGAVLLLLGLSWLWSSSQTPDQFLKRLDDPNSEVRWRTAADLSQVLLRDDNLSLDPRFALGLAERLHRTLDEAGPAELALAQRLPKLSLEDAATERKAREPDRMFIGYLVGCLGSCRVPVGVPLLAELTETEAVADADALALRRHGAMMALAQLGQKTRSFDQLHPERQAAVLSVLEEEASGGGDRGQWAGEALAMLRGRQQGAPTMRGLDRVFERCADDPDLDMRKLTAFALNFWDGTPEENQRVEETLVRLAARPPAGSDDGAALQVCYNATAALARRGSDRVQPAVLAEMLDEAKLLKTFSVTPPQGGPPVPDEVAARATMLNALQAVAELGRKQPKLDLSALKPMVDALSGHPLPAIREPAQKAQLALQGS